MSANDGGPAFPRTFVAIAATAGDEPVTLTVPEPGPPGMSLRVWLAGTARDKDIAEYRVNGHGRLMESRVEARYCYADAMLAGAEQRAAMEGDDDE